jgi:DNA-binding beta-propeller fold protein YncE
MASLSRPRALFACLILAVLSWPGEVPAKPRGTAPPHLMIWPAPPLPARIALLQTISRPSEAGVKVSAFGRLGNWLTGADKGNEILAKPFGVACDEQDNVCLTDTAEKTVSLFDRRRKKWSRFKKAGKLVFNTPVSVAKSGSTLYVADSAAGQVIVMSDQGKLLGLITNELARPTAVVLRKDTLFVADSQRHRVCAFSLSGQFRKAFGERGSGPGQFNFPTHLAVDRDGNLYVTDSLNGRIQVFDKEGIFKVAIGSLGDSPGHFSRPKGVAVDGLGHVYVIDGLFDNLQVFNAEGRLLLTVGESGSGPGQFWLPNGIAINSANEIFVTDSYNRRLQVLKYIGQP